ncbi:tRNA-Val4 [Bacillus subtilis]|uniref:tRNA-Val4 n=1 Tax=Bacillus TaxID=1386 RepID=UPI000C32580B|nr:MULTISPECIES: tRNA-Val4 [Bacillus]PKJ61545.1 tRNA-Val4 [Bacillus sp. SN32]TAH83752.1 tRNA-Val4 [Bacillus subtilis]TAH90634.1 tRNA-Val4 [Bacillus subtilis]
MKYSYKFEENPFGDLGTVLPEEISIFSDFIENIATEEQTNEYIDYIEKVSEGKYEDFEIELNATSVLIKKDVTIVENSFRIEEPSENSIETDQFRELLLIWRDKIPDIFKG